MLEHGCWCWRSHNLVLSVLAISCSVNAVIMLWVGKGVCAHSDAVKLSLGSARESGRYLEFVSALTNFSAACDAL